VLRAQNPETLKTISRLGRTALLQGKNPEAEALFRQSLEGQRRVLGPEHPDTLYSMSNLAAVYSEQGKYAQAEALHSQTLEIQRRVLGPEHPNTLSSMHNLAFVYRSQGKYAQAEALHSQTLEIQRRVLGPEHPSTLNSMNNLAQAYRLQGKYAQAEALQSQTLEILRRVLGPEHPDTLNSMDSLAGVYYEQGKYAQAEALESQTLEIMDALSCIDQCFIADHMLEQLPVVSQIGKTKVGGIDLNKARMRWVIEAAIALSPSTDGFTAAELAAQVRALGKQRASEYSARRAASDLKKLRGKNIVRRIEKTHRYEALPKGLRAMAALVVLRDKAIKPLLAAAQQLRPSHGAQNPRMLDTHYETIRSAMQGVFREPELAA
jgi:tetratricopeptide (TPR) repeat protein